ncbi:MAG: CpsD/CapB family tyrosine-protein kinase [Phycisphaerae bacterium]|jgi:capsular exopolysaccharide synthesis family protein
MAETTETPIAEATEVAARATLRKGAEEVFRSLWAALFFSGVPIGKRVLICSSDEGEGASTIACGLALAGSTPAGAARVALVDFNIRKPTLHHMLGAQPTPGVCDVLVGGLAPEAAAQRINTSLDLYAVGDTGQRRLEVLRSDKLAAFLSILADGYDHVLIDAAAVNHYPDAQVLAGVVKDTVLVARTDHTPREAVAQAKKRLETGGGKVVGLVLNMRTYPIPGFLYRRV